LFDNSLGGGHGNQFFGNIGFLAVFFTGSTIFITGTAEPSSIGATSSGTYGTITILFDNFLGGGHGNQFLSNVGFLAVFFTGGTVLISRTAKPSRVGATSSGADCTFTILFDNSLGGGHGNQFFGNIGFLAVFFTGSTIFITGTAEPSSIGATSSRTNGTITILFGLFFFTVLDNIRFSIDPQVSVVFDNGKVEITDLTFTFLFQFLGMDFIFLDDHWTIG